MANKIVHWELMGPDDKAMTAFYGELFGWHGAATPGFDGYHLVDADQAGVGGAVGKGTDEMAAYLTIYIEVDDVDAHLAKAEAAGGKTVVPKQIVPDVVTFALFSDPAGNVVGLVEAETPTAT